jgi:hypothetical protein
VIAMKKKMKKQADSPKRSEIIEQLIYVQQVAAYDAGFGVDHTGDSDYVEIGNHLKKANRALFKLITLSPHAKAGAPPLTGLELHAKAGIIAALYGLRKDMEPNKDELAYIRLFAAEVSDFFRSNRHEKPSLTCVD